MCQTSPWMRSKATCKGLVQPSTPFHTLSVHLSKLFLYLLPGLSPFFVILFGFASAVGKGLTVVVLLSGAAMPRLYTVRVCGGGWKRRKYETLGPSWVSLRLAGRAWASSQDSMGVFLPLSFPLEY